MKKSISYGIVLFGLRFGFMMIHGDNKAHAELSLPDPAVENKLLYKEADANPIPRQAVDGSIESGALAYLAKTGGILDQNLPAAAALLFLLAGFALREGCNAL